jgi:hypothetical protein
MENKWGAEHETNERLLQLLRRGGRTDLREEPPQAAALEMTTARGGTIMRATELDVLLSPWPILAVTSSLSSGTVKPFITQTPSEKSREMGSRSIDYDLRRA